MTTENDEKLEENFKELLTEVSKIGSLLDEVDTIEEDKVDSNTPNTPPPTKIPVTDDNLQEYVYNSATSLIDSSLFTLDKIKQGVSSVMDPRELTALADLIKATTSSIDVLNKVAMEHKKMENAKEMKKMDIEAKKEIGMNKVNHQTNILVASREEVLEQLVNKTINQDKTSKQEKIIDV